MKTSTFKAKGRQGEHELAAIFGGKRTPGSGNAGGNDITALPEPYNALAMEAKRRAKLPAIATAPLAQAAYAARGSNLAPLVGYREDGGRWVVAMYAEDFKTFVDAVYETGRGSKLRALAKQLDAISAELRRFA